MVDGLILQQLQQVAKAGAELNIGLYDQLLPTLLVATPKEIEIYGLTTEKEYLPMVILETLGKRQAQAYALVLEAWSTQFLERAAEYDYRVRDMAPDDRDEVVQIIVAERDNPSVRFSMAKIQISPTGHRHLEKCVENGSDGKAKACGAFVITGW